MNRVPLVLLLALVAGCALLTAQSFDQRLAAAYQTNTSIRATAASAVNAGRLSSAQGENVLRLTDNARAVLDEAADGDERGLELAVEIMTNVSKFVEEHQP